MKKAGIYGGILLSAGLLCSLISFASYELKNKVPEDDKQMETAENKEEPSQSKEEDNALETGTVKEARVQAATRVLIKNYDTENGKMEEERIALPEAFVGKSRMELEKYLPEFSEVQSEKERETVNYQLESFSESCIYLSRTSRNSDYLFTYFITLKNEEVVVYLDDEETVYEYTGIYESNLEEADIAALKEGIRAENMSELYGILENYSS